MNRYDVIYSLGRDCSCAMYMRQTNLRSCSGPFDWLTHAGFEKRFELMINNFDEFLEQSDLLPMISRQHFLLIKIMIIIKM